MPKTQFKVVNSKDLKECWSTVRLVRNDCTFCERYAKCNYSCKGEYPDADPDLLYTSQLELLELRQKIQKILIRR